MKPSIAREVHEQLAMLAEKPKLGTPCPPGPFEGLRAFKARIDRLPLSREFTMLYLVNEEAQSLDLMDFGVMDGDSKDLLMPSFQTRPAPPPVPPRARIPA